MATFWFHALWGDLQAGQSVENYIEGVPCCRLSRCWLDLRGADDLETWNSWNVWWLELRCS